MSELMKLRLTIMMDAITENLLNWGYFCDYIMSLHIDREYNVARVGVNRGCISMTVHNQVVYLEDKHLLSSRGEKGLWVTPRGRKWFTEQLGEEHPICKNLQDVAIVPRFPEPSYEVSQ
jgi:hypothetical protein